MRNRKADKKILIYSQDLGGAKYMAPILEGLDGAFPAVTVAHPLSETVFKRRGISHLTLSRFFRESPITENGIAAALTDNNISGVFCTVSSTYADTTNANLIKVSRLLGIRTFGVLDHWKGLDRFFDPCGAPTYLPDIIGCIDEFSAFKISRFCSERERIYITGHPHLEKCLRIRKKPSGAGSPIKVLIVSQPYLPDRRFTGLFLKKIGTSRLIDDITRCLGRIRSARRLGLLYRPHPKEGGDMDLPGGVDLDRRKDAVGISTGDTIFIGLNSMLLAEAYLAGSQCVIIDLPRFSNIADIPIPYRIGYGVKKPDKLPAVLQHAVDTMGRCSLSGRSALAKTVRGSLRRSSDRLKRFAKECLREGRI